MTAACYAVLYNSWWWVLKYYNFMQTFKKTQLLWLYLKGLTQIIILGLSLWCEHLPRPRTKPTIYSSRDGCVPLAIIKRSSAMHILPEQNRGSQQSTFPHWLRKGSILSGSTNDCTSVCCTTSFLFMKHVLSPLHAIMWTNLCRFRWWKPWRYHIPTTEVAGLKASCCMLGLGRMILTATTLLW